MWVLKSQKVIQEDMLERMTVKQEQKSSRNEGI